MTNNLLGLSLIALAIAGGLVKIGAGIDRSTAHPQNMTAQQYYDWNTEVDNLNK